MSLFLNLLRLSNAQDLSEAQSAMQSFLENPTMSSLSSQLEAVTDDAARESISQEINGLIETFVMTFTGTGDLNTNTAVPSGVAIVTSSSQAATTAASGSSETSNSPLPSTTASTSASNDVDTGAATSAEDLTSNTATTAEVSVSVSQSSSQSSQDGSVDPLSAILASASALTATTNAATATSSSLTTSTSQDGLLLSVGNTNSLSAGLSIGGDDSTTSSSSESPLPLTSASAATTQSTSSPSPLPTTSSSQSTTQSSSQTSQSESSEANIDPVSAILASLSSQTASTSSNTGLATSNSSSSSTSVQNNGIGLSVGATNSFSAGFSVGNADPTATTFNGIQISAGFSESHSAGISLGNNGFNANASTTSIDPLSAILASMSADGITLPTSTSSTASASVFGVTPGTTNSPGLTFSTQGTTQGTFGFGQLASLRASRRSQFLSWMTSNFMATPTGTASVPHQTFISLFNEDPVVQYMNSWIQTATVDNARSLYEDHLSFLSSVFTHELGLTATVGFSAGASLGFNVQHDAESTSLYARDVTATPESLPTGQFSAPTGAPSGPKPSGPKPSGPKPSGPKPSGAPEPSNVFGFHGSFDHPDGPKPSGAPPSGAPHDAPSGVPPSGVTFGKRDEPEFTDAPSGVPPSDVPHFGDHSGVPPSGTPPSGAPSGAPHFGDHSGVPPSGAPHFSGHSGIPPSGPRPSGLKPSGRRPSGIPPSGIVHAYAPDVSDIIGFHGSFNHPGGPAPSGPKPSGPRPSGDHSGVPPSGLHSGIPPSGAPPSGAPPSGAPPSGVPTETVTGLAKRDDIPSDIASEFSDFDNFRSHHGTFSHPSGSFSHHSGRFPHHSGNFSDFPRHSRPSGPLPSGSFSRPSGSFPHGRGGPRGRPSRASGEFAEFTPTSVPTGANFKRDVSDDNIDTDGASDITSGYSSIFNNPDILSLSQVFETATESHVAEAAATSLNALFAKLNDEHLARVVVLRRGIDETGAIDTAAPAPTATGDVVTANFDDSFNKIIEHPDFKSLSEVFATATDSKVAEAAATSLNALFAELNSQYVEGTTLHKRDEPPVSPQTINAQDSYNQITQNADLQSLSSLFVTATDSKVAEAAATSLNVLFAKLNDDYIENAALRKRDDSAVVTSAPTPVITGIPSSIGEDSFSEILNNPQLKSLSEVFMTATDSSVALAAASSINEVFASLNNENPGQLLSAQAATSTSSSSAETTSTTSSQSSGTTDPLTAIRAASDTTSASGSQQNETSLTPVTTFGQAETSASLTPVTTFGQAESNSVLSTVTLSAASSSSVASITGAAADNGTSVVSVSVTESASTTATQTTVSTGVLNQTQSSQGVSLVGGSGSGNSTTQPLILPNAASHLAPLSFTLLALALLL